MEDPIFIAVCGSIIHISCIKELTLVNYGGIDGTITINKGLVNETFNLSRTEYFTIRRKIDKFIIK